MYEIFEKLLKENDMTAYKVSKETGISQPTLSDWKNGKSTPKQDKLIKIADYFGVSLEYLLYGNEARRFPPSIPNHKECDIAKILSHTIHRLKEGDEALLFYGKIMDDTTRELLQISLENSLQIGETSIAVSKRYKRKPKKI